MAVSEGWGKNPMGKPAPKVRAQFDSVCPECWEEIDEGQAIFWSAHHGAYVCSVTCR